MENLVANDAGIALSKGSCGDANVCHVAFLSFASVESQRWGDHDSVDIDTGDRSSTLRKHTEVRRHLLVLTYNIAGLPERPSSGLPQESVTPGRIFCARLTSALGRAVSADVPNADGVTYQEPTGWTALCMR